MTMKIIALLAVLAMCLLGFVGPKARVGGPMAMMMVSLLVMLAVSIHEAKSHERGPLGWIANVLAAIVGGFVAVTIFNLGVMEALLSGGNFEGSLAASDQPLKYVVLAVMALIVVLGAWAPLLLVNRSRRISA